MIMENQTNILGSKFKKKSEIYPPTEHIAVDEVIVQFKENIIFQQYISEREREREREISGIKICKLCDIWLHIQHVYLGKHAQMSRPHKEEHWNWFGKIGVPIKYSRTITSPRQKPKLLNNLHYRKINAHGTLYHNR
jgi:hypothetical protein